MLKVQNKKNFINGVKDSVPVALAYLAVSFALGVSASNLGLKWFVTVIMSMTNLTSAGQQAGILIIAASGTVIEIIFTQLVINARYFLMSLSLSQRLDPKITLLERLLIAFGITDEIFAIAVSKKEYVTKWYMLGLISLPWLGWTSGTLLGVFMGDVLPTVIVSALSIAIYAMFISIVITALFNDVKILPVVIISAILSCVLYYVPIFAPLSEVSCVICGIVASVFGALMFPIKEEGEQNG
ncbi:MAG: AzlC family ABC transporter permease [Clostridia bacterium]|nr:AzlC family ABC transporter permease [Clostridia bacterium]